MLSFPLVWYLPVVLVVAVPAVDCCIGAKADDAPTLYTSPPHSVTAEDVEATNLPVASYACIDAESGR